MQGPSVVGDHYIIWQYEYGLWSFHMGGTKLERFLPKNQHPQRKLLNFENWISGGLRCFQKSEFLKTIIFIFPEKNTSNWNHGLISMLLLFFINKIRNLRQFSKKNLNKPALSHAVWYTNTFLHWNITKISLFIS